jgi:transposase InsO family protein
VAKLLVEEVIVRFGTPYVIHTDKGVQFESNLFQEMCRLLQIQKTRTTPYHPQSDGMVERNNRTIFTILSAFVNEHQNDWDEHLPYILIVYRAAEHETTGITPN